MTTIKAALFDFGGVLTSGPWEAFARYERDNGLPDGFIRKLNATNPDTNAWARLERSEVSFEEFCELYEAEALAAGHKVDARYVMSIIGGQMRPEMVEAVRRCKQRLKTGMLTNNFVRSERGGMRGEILSLFDVVVESSKAGVRKPDPRFYEIACELLEITPPEAVFLDDLGVNLKPAREIGMTTIKVTDPAQALDELEAAVGFAVR